MYRSIPTAHPPPGQTPGHLTFLKNFGQILRYVASFNRRSNAPPVRASKRVKSPAFQGKQNRLPLEINRIAYLWKPVLQNFLVQLVCAPRFKQRHIPRYNYIKRQQQQKKTHVESKNCEVLFVSDRWQVKCPTGGPHFGSNSPLYGA